jgi:hypothetical protein
MDSNGFSARTGGVNSARIVPAPGARPPRGATTIPRHKTSPRGAMTGYRGVFHLVQLARRPPSRPPGPTALSRTPLYPTTGVSRSHRCRDRVRFAPLRHGRTGGRHRFSCNHSVRRVSRGGGASDSTYAEYRGSRLCDLAAASAGSRSYGGSSWIHLRSDRCWRGSGCGRSSVIVKIKRNAATMLLNAGAFVPSSDRCNWNRRMSSAAAVSGDRDRNAAKRERI